jgi:tetrahydromethanopterin S-methyltransferase subunit H
MMIRYDLPQKVCEIGGVKIGGQPGENPPLLIGNMFQKGDKIIENRKEGKFNRKEAEEKIHGMEQLSRETGVPGMVAMVANSEDEMKAYVDFFISVTKMPFAIDIWMQKTRLAAARYVAGLGLQDRVLYNSITPWDEDIEAQVAELKELGIRHVVIQAFDMEDKKASGRLTSLKRLLPLVEKGNFKSILVDTAVMNLPATAFSILSNRLIKKEFGFPVGCAPSNGTYMWRKSAGTEHQARFLAIDAAIQAITTLDSDFIFYGPMTGNERIFYSTAAANSILATMAFNESSVLPDSGSPLGKMFPEVLKQLTQEKGVE